MSAEYPHQDTSWEEEPSDKRQERRWTSELSELPDLGLHELSIAVEGGLPLQQE